MLKGGWQFIGGKWYYLSVHGDMQTGWLKYNNDWYCLDTNGEMLRNTVVDDYFLNESGKWVNISMAEATGIYSLKLRFADGEVVNVTGIDLKKASHHHYYDNETVPQAIVADAICKYYANENEYKHQWCILKMDGKTGYADGQGYYVGYGKHPEDK